MLNPPKFKHERRACDGIRKKKTPLEGPRARPRAHMYISCFTRIDYMTTSKEISKKDLAGAAFLVDAIAVLQPGLSAGEVARNLVHNFL
jgi:hypothetical protein